LGYGSVVTAEHRIDFTDRVTIGRCTTIAGRNSSIWTHNRRVGSSVLIGDFCYVGSEVRMAPGAHIGDCCVVGLGAVVTRGSIESNWLIGGVPARPLRQLKTDDYELVFAKTRPDLPDEALEDERNPFFKPIAHSATGG
jgi:acetyltransferase-like isoleucine patch superfamily enzyme